MILTCPLCATVVRVRETRPSFLVGPYGSRTRTSRTRFAISCEHHPGVTIRASATGPADDRRAAPGSHPSDDEARAAVVGRWRALS